MGSAPLRFGTVCLCKYHQNSTRTTTMSSYRPEIWHRDDLILKPRENFKTCTSSEDLVRVRVRCGWGLPCVTLSLSLSISLCVFVRACVLMCVRVCLRACLTACVRVIDLDNFSLYVLSIYSLQFLYYI